MSKKNTGVLLLLLSFIGGSQVVAQKAPLNSTNADVSFDVGPSPTNGYSGTMGLGGNAGQNSPDHTTTVLLRPKPPYDFIGEPNAPMFFSGTVPVNPAPTEVARNHGWIIKNVVADTEVILSGKIGTGGPGGGPTPEFDVNTATVDLILGVDENNENGVSEADEVFNSNTGPGEAVGLSVWVGTGPIKCRAVTSGLSAGMELILSSPSGRVKFSTNPNPEDTPMTPLALDNEGAVFYIWLSDEGEYEEIDLEYSGAGLDGGIAKDIAFVTMLYSAGDDTKNKELYHVHNPGTKDGAIVVGYHGHHGNAGDTTSGIYKGLSTVGGNHYVAGIVWNADVEEALKEEIAERCASTSKGVAVVIIGHSLGGEKALKMVDWFDKEIKAECATKTRHISVVSIDAVECSGWFCSKWVEYKTAPTATTATFQNHYQTKGTPHGAKITGAKNTIYDFDPNFAAYVGTANPHKLIDDYLADKTVLKHSTTAVKQKLAGWVKLEADMLVTKAK